MNNSAKYPGTQSKIIRIIWISLVSLLLLNTPIKAQNAIFTSIPDSIEPIDAPFKMEQLSRPVFHPDTFNIRDFGAAEIGPFKWNKCTDEIREAIQTAYLSGGGTVLIPKGIWLTGPIHLKSNINLHLEEGAVVRFSQDKSDYLPVVLQRYEGVEAYNYSPLIYAFELRNVAITGKGIFDGQGEHWWRFAKTQPRAIATNVPLEKRDYGKGAGREGMRPNFAVFWKCTNVLVEGVTFVDGPMWNVHLVYTNRAIVRGIKVKSLKAGNGNGIVIDSSSDILIEYNNLSTGDDAISLKSGFNREGLEINKPTQNVVIRNFQAFDVRTGSGGVVFGSETSGGIRNIYVHDGYFERCDNGIRFKTERGRGNVVENIFINNIRMKTILDQAISFNTFYTGPGKVGPSPQVRNISIRNINIDGVKESFELIGLPEKWLENITLENIEIFNAKEGARLSRVKNLVMKNINIRSDERAVIADDVYECHFDSLILLNKTNIPPFLFKGRYTGAIVIPHFIISQIEFSDGLGPEIIMEKLPIQTW